MPGGRPSDEPKTKLIAVRLPPRLLAFVEQLAREQNVTRSQALRALVEQRLRERQEDIRGWRPFASRAIAKRTP
jgi:metal-responsive CopG/Arc/MetJ family transcriptional regulator